MTQPRTVHLVFHILIPRQEPTAQGEEEQSNNISQGSIITVRILCPWNDVTAPPDLLPGVWIRQRSYCQHWVSVFTNAEKKEEKWLYQWKHHKLQQNCIEIFLQKCSWTFMAEIFSFLTKRDITFAEKMTYPLWANRYVFYPIDRYSLHPDKWLTIWHIFPFLTN